MHVKMKWTKGTILSQSFSRYNAPFCEKEVDAWLILRGKFPAVNEKWIPCLIILQRKWMSGEQKIVARLVGLWAHASRREKCFAVY